MQTMYPQSPYSLRMRVARVPAHLRAHNDCGTAPLSFERERSNLQGGAAPWYAALARTHTSDAVDDEIGT